MKILSAKKVQAEIDRRNALFKKASPTKKRVLIAQDVLKQIRRKKIIPSHSGFLSGWETERNAMDNESVQTLLINNEIEQCDCCALGALMVCTTLYANKQTVEQIDSDMVNLGTAIEKGRKFGNGFHKLFSRAQMELIEQAYESGEGWFSCKRGYEVNDHAVEFGDSFWSSIERLKAIMKNIINNNGTFVPAREAA